MSLLHTFSHPSRVHDVRFCTRVDGAGELLLVAAEDKKVTVYDATRGDHTSLPVLATLVGHSNRSAAFVLCFAIFGFPDMTAA